MARTDLENVNGFILTCAFRGETLRAMDRFLEDKLRLSSGLRFGRTGALSWPRENKNVRTDEKHAKIIASGTYVVEELPSTVPVPSGVLPPQKTNRVQLFVFEQRIHVMQKNNNDALILDR